MPVYSAKDQEIKGNDSAQQARDTMHTSQMAVKLVTLVGKDSNFGFTSALPSIVEPCEWLSFSSEFVCHS